MTESTADLLPSDFPAELVERYRPVRLLGEGAMGQVFEAVQTSLSRRVAVKLVRPDAFRDMQTARRFQEEARILSKLSHPNIVRLFDAGFAAGGPYIATELVEGVTWTVHQGPRRMPWEEALLLMAQLLDGLEYLQKNGVIHRDLKPDNIFVVGGRVVKLIDFGLAKHLAHRVDLTQEGFAVGTPVYMSPEQILGEEVSPAWDVYAAGVILYRALSGRFPFPTGSTQELVAAKVEGEPDPLARSLPVAPGWLQAAVDGCLTVEAGRRIQTVKEMREALAPGLATLDTSQLVARPASTPASRAARPARPGPAVAGRGRPMAAAAAVGVAVGCAALWLLSATGERATVTEPAGSGAERLLAGETRAVIAAGRLGGAGSPGVASGARQQGGAVSFEGAVPHLEELRRAVKACGFDQARDAVFHTAGRGVTAGQKAAKLEACAAAARLRERLHATAELVARDGFHDAVPLASSQPFYDSLKELRRTDHFCAVLGIPWKSGVERLESSRWRLGTKTTLWAGPGRAIAEREVPLQGRVDFESKAAAAWDPLGKKPVFRQLYMVTFDAPWTGDAAELVLCSRDLPPGGAYEVWIAGGEAPAALWFHREQQAKESCLYHAFDARCLKRGQLAVTVRYSTPVAELRRMKSRLDRLAFRYVTPVAGR
ncbi:MAG: serine/threonine protein kinase [Candidatus Wallbacteria bacterium]|nr:serine/threonine protein kinase [Candidatus Wallbacteria bacterium]